MRRRFIKAGKPQLIGNLERLHLTEKKHFVNITGIDDLNQYEKPQEFEQLYKFNRKDRSWEKCASKSYV